MELNKRMRTVKNAFISRSFSLFSAADIETISGLFVRTSSASASAKSSDVWPYFGPLYCEYQTRLRFIGCKSLSCSHLVLFPILQHSVTENILCKLSYCVARLKADLVRPVICHISFLVHSDAAIVQH